MGKRGPSSLSAKLINDKDLKERFSKHKEIHENLEPSLTKCLKDTDKHPWFWTAVYDIPQKSKKKFYQNLNDLKTTFKWKELTKSVLAVWSLREAAILSILIEECHGTGYTLLSVKPAFSSKGLMDEWKKEIKRRMEKEVIASSPSAQMDERRTRYAGKLTEH